jgi:hypothetical protein
MLLHPFRREPKMRDDRRKLPIADATELCEAAQRAWNIASDRARRVRFRRRGKAYVSTLTTFRMLVFTTAGTPVACRWN